MLQVRVELVAKISHDPLADDGVEVGLPDSNQAAENRRNHHDGDEDGQQVEALLAEADGDREFQHIGIDYPQDARQHDSHQHDQDLSPVRLE